jgi:hypothetical protein
MIAVKKPAATYEDLVASPENMVGEIIDGELCAQPRPPLCMPTRIELGAAQ